MPTDIRLVKTSKLEKKARRPLEIAVNQKHGIYWTVVIPVRAPSSTRLTVQERGSKKRCLATAALPSSNNVFGRDECLKTS
ncbi:hypothetical protein V6N13_120765 [Hibiscus sabdariffa]|uniref:Uncharacterized protein n=1 Tax=Hibiscus sabdariffa TaxID=183260 RepID=A0ABR2E578_9ROSI